MIQQTLTNSMSVADLVPKAATKLPEARTGDGAFAEALAGAHTVHDRRDVQASDRGNDRERTAPPGQSTDRSRAIEDTRSDRADEVANAAGRPDDRNAAATSRDDAQAAEPTATSTGADDSTEVREDAPVDDQQSADPTAVDADASDAATAAAGATLAVAATPATASVATDVAVDAVLVPTTDAAQATDTTAIDAAMRLAIDADAPVAVAQGAAPTEEATAQPAVAVTDDAALPELDAEVATPVATTQALDVEDAGTGDVAGPTRPLASAPVVSSGPIVETSAGEETAPTAPAAPTAEPADAVAPKLVQGAAVATTVVDEVADGGTTDAAAQLVQAAVVEVDDSAETPDVAADPLDAPVVRAAQSSASASDDADVAVAAGLDGEDPVDARAAARAAAGPATPAAPVTQPQPSAAVLSAQQLTANAQAAKAADQAAEETAGDAAPGSAKLDPLSGNQAQPLSTGRGEQVAPGIRVREGLFAGAGVQERIDHIAEQLATRLRMSHSAGGSQVQLNLKPRELGEVTVSMQVREGVVAATVLVDRPETASTMERNLEELKKSLESQGLSIQELSVGVRGDAGAGGANARTAAQLRHEATRTSAGSTSSIAGAAAVMPGFSGAREVDPDETHDGAVSVLA